MNPLGPIKAQIARLEAQVRSLNRDRSIALFGVFLAFLANVAVVLLIKFKAL